MRIKGIIIYFLSVCLVLLFSCNSGYGQDNGFIGIWKLNNKQQISGRVYVNAIPNLIIVKQLSARLLIESRTSDPDGKDEVILDTLNLDGSSSEKVTASARNKKTRIENIVKDKSFTRTSFFSLPGLPEKPEYIRTENWNLGQNNKELIITREFISKVDSADKWKVRGNYDKTSLEALALDKISGKGIQFKEGLNWKDVVRRAKAEKKMIFVDCYATWCRPCKVMDVDVYPVDRVGELMNSKFISLKLQMDTAKGDKEAIQLLYPLAKRFANDYNVFALPTLLFFSPDGRILHKNIGGMSINEFLTTVNEALNPSKQLYTQLDHIRKGKIDESKFPALVKKMRELQEKVPDSYMQSYFKGLSEIKILMKENLQLAIDYPGAIRSTDQLFMLCYKRPEAINKTMGWRAADYIVRSVITKEEIRPDIERSNQINKIPEWLKLKDSIRKKYNSKYADVLIVQSQMEWYKQKKDWKNYTKAMVVYMNVSGFEEQDSWVSLIMEAEEIATYSNNTDELATALKWADKSIQLFKNESDKRISPSDWVIQNDKNLLASAMDMKAALFYKMGKVTEAISLYEDIIKLNPERNTSLDKLRAGENPWPDIIVNR